MIGKFGAVIAVSNSLDVRSRTIGGVSVEHPAEATIYAYRRGKMTVLIPFEFTVVPLANNNLEPEIPAQSAIPYSGSISSQSTSSQYYPSSYYPKYQPFSSSSSTDYRSSSNYASNYPYNTQRAEQQSILTTKPHQYPYYQQNSNPSYSSSSSVYYPSQSSYSSPYSTYSSTYPYDSIVNRQQQVIPSHYTRQVGKYLN